MELQAVGVPDPLQGPERQAAGGRHGAPRPVRRSAGRFAREDALQHGLHLGLRGGRPAGRARLIAKQAVHPLFGEPLRRRMIDSISMARR